MSNMFEGFSNKKVYYSDIDSNMTINWHNDLSLKTNAHAVAQSLINIVTTKKGTMPFDPDFGTNITSELFGVMTPFMMSTVSEDVANSIRKYEPRVDSLNVEMVPSVSSKNSIEVHITFTTTYDVNDPQIMSFTIEQS